MTTHDKGRDLSAISAAFFLTFLGTGAAQPFIIGYVQDAKGVTLAQSSLVLATVYLTFAVFRFFVGAIVSVTGLHAAKLFGVTTYALYPLLVMRAESLPGLLVASALWGLGAPLLWTASLTQVMNRAEAGRYGTAAGIVRGCSMTALFLGHYLLSFIYARWGDVPVLWFACGSAAAGIGAMALSPARRIERPRPSLATFVRVMARRETVLLAVLLLFSGIGYGVVLNGFKGHIETLHGAAWLARLLPLFSLTGIACNFGGGYLSDRIGRWPAIAGAYGLGGAGLLLAWAAPHPAATGVAMVCMGALFGLVPLSAFGWVGDHTTPEDRAALMGYVFCFRDAGIAGAIQVRGLIATFDAALLAFAAVSLVCAAVAGWAALGPARAPVEPRA